MSQAPISQFPPALSAGDATTAINYWSVAPIPAPFTEPRPEGWYDTGRMMYEIDRSVALEFAAGILLAEFNRWWALVERCDRLEARIKALLGGPGGSEKQG